MGGLSAVGTESMMVVAENSQHNHGFDMDGELAVQSIKFVFLGESTKIHNEFLRVLQQAKRSTPALGFLALPMIDCSGYSKDLAQFLECVECLGEAQGEKAVNGTLAARGALALLALWLLLVLFVFRKHRCCWNGGAGVVK